MYDLFWSTIASLLSLLHKSVYLLLAQIILCTKKCQALHHCQVKKWQHVMELLNFFCQLLLQPHLFLIKDPIWNSPEEMPKWDYLSFLSFVLFLFGCLWLQHLGLWLWSTGVFCLIFSIWVSFNVQNVRGVVNKSLFIYSVVGQCGCEAVYWICPLRESVFSCNHRFSWCI